MSKEEYIKKLSYLVLKKLDALHNYHNNLLNVQAELSNDHSDGVLALVLKQHSFTETIDRIDIEINDCTELFSSDDKALIQKILRHQPIDYKIPVWAISLQTILAKQQTILANLISLNNQLITVIQDEADQAKKELKKLRRDIETNHHKSRYINTQITRSTGNLIDIKE
ncbi:MAG: hypothetical protein BGN88_08165 [Clostridiales bacterium 43-6]|nr:MAG: hypothetical protein BGN88_08165 [Clostridiales bacterium 43-6]